MMKVCNICWLESANIESIQLSESLECYVCDRCVDRLFYELLKVLANFKAEYDITLN